ncbi:hypothetical protein AB6C87_24495, partial [Vibrio splendidus]
LGTSNTDKSPRGFVGRIRFESGLVEIDESIVEEFNEKIAKNANDHIFSSREQEVNNYKLFVGKALRVINEYA